MANKLPPNMVPREFRFHHRRRSSASNRLQSPAMLTIRMPEKRNGGHKLINRRIVPDDICLLSSVRWRGEYARHREINW